MEGQGGEIRSSDEEGHGGHASSKDSIFRIPGLFKMRNEQVYTPYKFSIGPWHFCKTQGLRAGQKLKQSDFERLINRFSDPAAKKRELEESIKNECDKARECYAYDGGENMAGAKEEFENILLVDGCFIIELLRRRDHPFRLRGHNYQFIYHDLLLLDNQIPWFVLELLFNKTNDYPYCPTQSLVELAIEFFGPVIPPYPTRERARARAPERARELELELELERERACERERPIPNILHLVDFVRYLLVGSREENTIDIFEWGYRLSIPSATRLEEAGIKFQKIESKDPLAVTFDKGVFKIPWLRIDPLTETIFRNLIIYEQCSDFAPRVTWYGVLLDCLVNTSDDVDLLSREEIFDNRISSEETANFFNRVCDNAVMTGFCYAQLCQDVNDYCKRIWPTWRASLIRNYFTKPWAIVSVVFATIVLHFTIMQVFYK
ncbi:hypothetical protein SLE2022_323300 [Rubroshorea leprosula]